MNKEVEKGLVPKLRFSEFLNAGEWNEKPLGKIAEIITGNTPQTSDSDNYVGNKMFVSPADISDSRYIVKTKTTLSELGYSKTRHIPANSVLFVCIGSTIGKIAQNKFDCATNQQINSVVPFRNYSSDFLYFALDNDSSRIAELAGRHAVPIINKSSFSDVSINIPPEEKEQTKIAACLSSLDDLITAQTQKIAALKTHKKGLMQQLFPQEGETVPKLRFPEFEDEWEWKELNNLASKVNVKNKNFEVKVVLTNSASYGIVRQDSYFDREIVTQGNLTGYYVVDVDDFIYNPRISNNALVGSLKRNNLVKGVMSPLYTVFRFKQGNLSFFEQYFETIFWHGYMKNLANIGARHDRLNISNEDFFNLPLPFPTLSEQQKIADCLSSLDELINAKIKKCDALKLHKKGLMQGLFPTAEDTKI